MREFIILITTMLQTRYDEPGKLSTRGAFVRYDRDAATDNNGTPVALNAYIAHADFILRMP